MIEKLNLLLKQIKNVCNQKKTKSIKVNKFFNNGIIISILLKKIVLT